MRYSIRENLLGGSLLFIRAGVAATLIFSSKSAWNYAMSGGANEYYYVKSSNGWEETSGNTPLIEYRSIENNNLLSRAEKNAEWKSLENGSKLCQWATWYAKSSREGKLSSPIPFESSLHHQKKIYDRALSRKQGADSFVHAGISGLATGLMAGLFYFLTFYEPKKSKNSC